MDYREMLEFFVGAANLRGRVCERGALLEREVGAVSDKLVRSQVVLRCLLFPGQALEVVRLQLLGGFLVAKAALGLKERPCLVLDLAVEDAQVVRPLLVAGSSLPVEHLPDGAAAVLRHRLGVLLNCAENLFALCVVRFA